MSSRTPTWTTGERLAKARRDAGLSQHDMAARLGVTKTTVLNWENGHTSPKLYAIARWAEITDCALWWILGTDPDEGEHGSWCIPGQLELGLAVAA